MDRRVKSGDDEKNLTFCNNRIIFRTLTLRDWIHPRHGGAPGGAASPARLEKRNAFAKRSGGVSLAPPRASRKRSGASRRSTSIFWKAKKAAIPAPNTNSPGGGAMLF